MYFDVTKNGTQNQSADDFLRTGFYLAFFRQVKGNMGTFMGNLGKNPSHPQKFSCSYTYGERNCPAL